MGIIIAIIIGIDVERDRRAIAVNLRHAKDDAPTWNRHIQCRIQIISLLIRYAYFEIITVCSCTFDSVVVGHWVKGNSDRTIGRNNEI